MGVAADHFGAVASVGTPKEVQVWLGRSQADRAASRHEHSQPERPAEQVGEARTDLRHQQGNARFSPIQDEQGRSVLTL